MRPTPGRTRALAVGLTLAACLLAPGSSGARSLEEIQRCLASNVPKRSSVLHARLASTHRGGSGYAHQAQIYWRRSPEGVSQTLVCMTAPRDLRGLAILVHEKEGERSVWAYLPDEGRVLRFNPREAARQSRIARTAVSYDDLRYLPLNLVGARAEAPESAVLGERAVARVQLRLPTAREGPYSRVVALVDEESCVPLELRFHGVDGELVKVATAEPGTLETAGSIRLARSLSVEDRGHGTTTAIRLEEVEIDPELRERTFKPQSLERGRCLR